MLYLHDLWVNMFEGEENGYNVCEFHEWRKTDGVELFDQIPLLKIEKNVFELIENDLIKLPQSLLKAIHKKSYYRKNHEQVEAEYCAVVTDGSRIIAFDTHGYDIPIRKSRLIPRQEQLVYEMIKNAPTFKISTEELNGWTETEKEYHILSPNPKEMIGLTRSERMFKQILYMALDHLNIASEEEIRYWYLEWNPKAYEKTKEKGKEELWEKLYDEVKEKWSNKHYQFGKMIIKGQPFFEKLWGMEEEELNISIK